VNDTSWSTSELADAIEVALRSRAKQDDLEQVVYGFDALDELQLHPIVQQAYRDKGYGVWPEQRYPGHWDKSRQNEGLRCDLVLTPPPEALPLRDAELKGTLFGDVAEAVDAEDAYWLEIKTVAQYDTNGPCTRYSSQLLSPVMKDVKKLQQAAGVRFGGLLLILFTESAEVAEHDLLAWHDRCLAQGYSIAIPAIRGLPITGRIGNHWCAAAIFGVQDGVTVFVQDTDAG